MQSYALIGLFLYVFEKKKHKSASKFITEVQLELKRRSVKVSVALLIEHVVACVEHK